MKAIWLLLPLSLCFSLPLSAQTDPPAPTDGDRVYERNDIQVPPSFPGGEPELQRFLATNIRYPALARKNNIQGFVAVSFVVNRDGSLSDIIRLKDIGCGCGAEVLRVLGLMPNWSPGMVDGKPVKVRFVLPVKFRLEGPTPKKKRGLFGRRD